MVISYWIAAITSVTRSDGTMETKVVLAPEHERHGQIRLVIAETEQWFRDRLGHTVRVTIDD